MRRSQLSPETGEHRKEAPMSPRKALLAPQTNSDSHSNTQLNALRWLEGSRPRTGP